MSLPSYMPYSEIMQSYPDENELNELISSFKKEPTFRFLAMINNFLALYPPSEKTQFEEVQKFLVANLLDDQIFERIKKCLTKLLTDQFFIDSKFYF